MPFYSDWSNEDLLKEFIVNGVDSKKPSTRPIERELTRRNYKVNYSIAKTGVRSFNVTPPPVSPKYVVWLSSKVNPYKRKEVWAENALNAVASAFPEFAAMTDKERRETNAVITVEYHP